MCLSFIVGRYLGVEVLSYLFYIFNHLRACKTVVQDSWTILFILGPLYFATSYL